MTVGETMLQNMSDLLLDISGPEESDNQRVDSNLPATSLVKALLANVQCNVSKLALTDNSDTDISEQSEVIQLLDLIEIINPECRMIFREHRIECGYR